MKYVDVRVVFQEIPDEITLAINISGCPIRCPDCHSKHLWTDIGESLNRDSLHHLIESNKGITCISFMGGDSNVPYLLSLFNWVRTRHPDLKIAWYSGREEPLKRSYIVNLDYIKMGPYIKECGPINLKTTNQRMYKIYHYEEGGLKIEDITSKFWKDDKDINTGI